jgi:two-component system response regulator PilR (NtrC family)
MRWPAGWRWTRILEEIERAYIEKAMECTDGNKNKAAELLGLTSEVFSISG